MPTTSDKNGLCSARWFTAVLTVLVVACMTSACGSDEDNKTSTALAGTGTGATGGSGGAGGSGGSAGAGASSADAASDGFLADTSNPDSATDSATDRLSPPNRDASDNPNCRLPDPAPVTCFAADPPPPLSPRVECLRSPREFADPIGYVGQIRMRGDTLYWTIRSEWTTGTQSIGIWEKKAAANPTRLLALPSIVRFEIDDTAIYFSMTGDGGPARLMRMNPDATGMMMLISDLGWGGFAIDENRIYFDTSDGKLVAVSKLSGGTEEPVAGPTSLRQVVGIDDNYIYWNDGTEPDVTLRRVQKGSSNIETLAAGLPGPGFMLQGNGVLVAAANKYILEVPKEGGCPKLLVSTNGFETFPGLPAIVADDAAIYWRGRFGSDLGTVTLSRAPRSGGVAVNLFSSAERVHGIGVTLLTPLQVIFTAEASASSRPTMQVADRL